MDRLLEIKNSTIFLDIDGTVLCDGFSHIDENMTVLLSNLKKDNQVFICSNGPRERNIGIANKIGVLVTNENFKKPSSKCLEGLDVLYKNKVVVGDKYISDGIFSLNIGAKFIKFPRFVSGQERFPVKISYFIDDILGSIIFKIFPFIKILRLNHLVKNFIIFTPLFFASRFFDKEAFVNALRAFISFSFLASFVYIINDIYDIKKDSIHPIKSLRPLASGIISQKKSLYFAFTLLILSFIVSFNTGIYTFLFIYLFLNILYSSYLKKKNISDILIVAIFYVIRILIGGFSTSTYISPWIILSVFFGALFITSCKRYSQYLLGSISNYSKELLLFCVYFSATLSIAVYSIWSVLEHNSPYLVYSSVFVVFIVFKMIEYIHTFPNKSEFPEILVFKDRSILSAFILWLLLVFYIFYLL